MDEKKLAEAIAARIAPLMEDEFVKDTTFARRALTKAYHSILRNEGYDVFYDDLLNFVETGVFTKNVY